MIASYPSGIIRHDANGHVGLDATPASVLVGDLGVDMGDFGTLVDGVDDLLVAFVDEGATELPGAGQFAIVGVEFLEEEKEFPDLLAIDQGLVDVPHLALDEVVHGRFGGKIGIGGEGDLAFFGPFGKDGKPNADDGRQVFPPRAEDNGLADEGGELEFVFDILGGELAAIGLDGDVLHAIDDHQPPGGIEVPGVASVHPAIAHVGLIGGGVFVIADEHVGVAGDDLADAILVRLADHDLAVPERDADGVVIGLTAGRRLQGVGADELGLAVELAQRNTHGEEELEGVGPEGRATGGGGAHASESEPIAEHGEEEDIGEGVASTPVDGGDAAIQEGVEDPLVEGGGIHDSRPHVGCNLLPETGRAQHEGGADLSEIMHGGLLGFGEIDLHAGNEVETDGVDLLHDPGERQDGNVFVFRSFGVGFEIANDVIDEALSGKHGELGVGGGAGGGAEDGDVVAPNGIHQFIEAMRGVFQDALPFRAESGDVDDAFVIGFAQAARFGEEDETQVGELFREIEELIDLLLVLGEYSGDLRVGGEVFHLFVQCIAIDAHAHAADGMDGQFGAGPPHLVVADESDDIILAETARGQGDSEFGNPCLVFAPGKLMPDTEVLFPHGNLVRRRIGPSTQQLGQGVVFEGGGWRRHFMHPMICLFRYRKNKNLEKPGLEIKAHPPSVLARSANMFS